MKRLLFIPKKGINELKTFLTLDEESIKKLDDIISESYDLSVPEICIKIINSLEVNDDSALEIYAISQYLKFILKAQNSSFDELIPEFELLLSEDEECEDIIENVKKNRELYSTLIREQPFDIITHKKEALLSGPDQSVQGIRTICDVRPMFDKERKNILEYFQVYTFDFIVTDSSGLNDQIILHFNQDTLNLLKDAITTLERKSSIIDAELKKLNNTGSE